MPQTITPTVTSLPTITPSPLVTTSPATVNWTVPFTVQAPHGTWDTIHEELCEEAAVLITMSYFNHVDISTPDRANQQLLATKDFEIKTLGFYEDTTADQTAQLIKDYYHYDQVQLLPNPTSGDIKAAVAAGKLVIAPTAGQQLHNPYFTPPGPLYHMVVIKGYTADGKFIVNDPGTKHGADYIYDQTMLMDAIHDWRPDRHIEQGAKVVLVIG